MKLVIAIAAVCLTSLALAGPAPVHQFVHFTVYISATTGEVDHYVADAAIPGEQCLKILEGMGGHQVNDGLAEVHFCRAVDAQGAPVPEIKLDPDTMAPLEDDSKAPVAKDEPPKVST